jgi:DNA-binding CsgD family transcriptional regulator
MKKEEEKIISEFVKKHQFFKKSKSEDIRDLKTASIVYLSGMRPNISPDNPLTTMQMFCLMLLSTGTKAKKCADILGLTVNTVQTYEKRLREKLGAKDRTHALVLACRRNYLTILKEEINF